MQQSHVIAAFCAAAGLAFAAAAGAEVYRWVDDQGVVHYSDRPRIGAKAVSVSATPAERARAEAESARESGESSPSGEGRTAAVRAEECQKARERLTTYRDAERLTARTDDGETRELSAEERIQAIVRAEENVASLCEEV